MTKSLYRLVGGTALLTLILVLLGMGGPLDWALISVLVWALGPYVLAVPIVHFAPPDKLARPLLPALAAVCAGGVLLLFVVIVFNWDPFWIIWLPFVQWLLLAGTAAMLWGDKAWKG